MSDYLLNNDNGGKKLTVHYWKQVFHTLINSTTIILNEYSAEIVLQKKYYYNIHNVTPFLIYCNAKIYSTAKNDFVNQKWFC